MAQIAEQVASARAGTNPLVICKLPSGWAVMAECQFLRGYCLLLPDPVVSSLNDLSPESRLAYLSDMAKIGDAVLQVTGAKRINYEILCNVVPELHAHVFPRYQDEPEELRTKPVWFYDWNAGPTFTPQQHGELKEALRQILAG